MLNKYDEKFKYSSFSSYDSPLDPYNFRRELANLFKLEGRFKLKKMEDPIEALLAIINALHSYSVEEKGLKECDKVCNPLCMAHKLFWINIYEQEVSLYFKVKIITICLIQLLSYNNIFI